MNVTKLVSDIVGAISIIAQPPAAPSIPKSVFETCGIDYSTIYSVPGEFPPSGEDAALFTGYGGLNPDTWPHVSGLPPFFGLCTNFQFTAGKIAASTLTSTTRAALEAMLGIPLKTIAPFLPITMHGASPILTRCFLNL